MKSRSNLRRPELFRVAGGAPGAAAFSLIEVVIAVALFSFALVSILILFGNLINNADGLAKRREAMSMAESLRDHLNFRGTNAGKDWSNALEKISNGSAADLYGMAVRWDWSNNEKNANSDQTKYIWTNGSGVASYDDARTGPLYRVKLELASSNSPGTNLANYTNALIVAQATFYSVGAAGTTLASNAPSVASVLVPVLK